MMQMTETLSTVMYPVGTIDNKCCYLLIIILISFIIIIINKYIKQNSTHINLIDYFIIIIK